MPFIYSDEPRAPYRGNAVPYEQQNANKSWATHYYNEVVLREMAKRTTDFKEKRQLEDEIAIAQRKQKHWEHHRNFELPVALRLVETTYKIKGGK